MGTLAGGAGISSPTPWSWCGTGALSAKSRLNCTSEDSVSTLRVIQLVQ